MNDETKTFVEYCAKYYTYDNDELDDTEETLFRRNAIADVPELCRIIREQDTEQERTMRLLLTEATERAEAQKDVVRMRNEWLGTISDIANELAEFGFVDESGGDGIVIAVRNALTKQNKSLRDDNEPSTRKRW